MKANLVITACLAAAARAHDASSSDPFHVHTGGYCQYPSLSSSFPLRSTPVCTNDTHITKYQPAGPLRSAANHAWTRALSCTANGASDEYCVYVSSTFSRGRGIGVLTTPERAEFIADLPAFADPGALAGVNTDPDPELSPYEFVHVPGKGMGVVARRPIYRGDLLMAFTPAIVIDYGAFENLPPADVQRLQAEAIDHLPAQVRERFLNLSTHDGASDYLEKVDKILRTNAFDVDISDSDVNSLYVVFPELSRFNHDCRPNADYWFDQETLAQYVYATRPIAVGEELTLTYMDPLRIRAKRQKKLHDVWGFTCSCPRCSQRAEMTAASDDRIRQIRRIHKQLKDYSSGSAATPQMADLMVSLYEQERLDGAIYEAYAFAAIEWNGVGEPWKAVRYARLAIEFGLAAVGPKDQDVIEMRQLAEDPFGHWSWMLRTSKRMSWGKMRDVGGGSYMRGGDDGEDE